ALGLKHHAPVRCSERSAAMSRGRGTGRGQRSRLILSGGHATIRSETRAKIKSANARNDGFPAVAVWSNFPFVNQPRRGELPASPASQSSALHLVLGKISRLRIAL